MEKDKEGLGGIGLGVGGVPKSKILWGGLVSEHSGEKTVDVEEEMGVVVKKKHKGNTL